jgi:hypothetical protein
MLPCSDLRLIPAMWQKTKAIRGFVVDFELQIEKIPCIFPC